jgi:AcrR family transcriptional regulator
MAARNGPGPERVMEIQRARILTAMSEVCAEGGASNASVAHVVQRAGVSRRTFYELFSDREDCFLGAFDEAVARASEYVLDGYDPKAGWVERVRTALTGLLRFLDVESDAGRLLIVGSLGAGAHALERRQRVLAQMIALVEEGRAEAKGGSSGVKGGPSGVKGSPSTGERAELPSLSAEGVVGGALSILHSRLSGGEPGSLFQLTGPLMSMIVLPYLGSAAARRELGRPVPRVPCTTRQVGGDPLRDMGMRLTYRTVRVLLAIAANPGASNRHVGDAAGVGDQGQISKLLARLQGLGLVENTWAGRERGAPNAWALTPKGEAIEEAITGRAGGRTRQVVCGTARINDQARRTDSGVGRASGRARRTDSGVGRASGRARRTDSGVGQASGRARQLSGSAAQINGRAKQKVGVHA